MDDRDLGKSPAGDELFDGGYMVFDLSQKRWLTEEWN